MSEVFGRPHWKAGRHPHAAAAAVLLWLGLAAAAWPQDGPARVSTDFVERRDISETVSVFAEVVSRRESDVAVRVAGVIGEVGVEVGDHVEAGAVMARLDQELLKIQQRQAEAALAEAEAGIEVAQSQVTTAQSGFDRIEGLRNTSAFNRSSFDERMGDLARARGELAEARARLASAEAAEALSAYELARSEITAPFAGTVLSLDIDPGEYVQTGDAVVRLIDTGNVEVAANVPARFMGGLRAGQQVAGQTDDGAELDLTVRAMLPLENPATRTRPVRFATDFSGAASVAIGQSVSVDVPVSAPKRALLVPKDAVIQSRGAWQVFVAEDGKAVPRQVEIGESLGEAFEVVSGLSAGDEVVVRGNERLQPNQPIAPDPVRPDPTSAQSGDAGEAAEGGSGAARRAAVEE